MLCFAYSKKKHKSESPIGLNNITAVTLVFGEYKLGLHPYWQLYSLHICSVILLYSSDLFSSCYMNEMLYVVDEYANK